MEFVNKIKNQEEKLNSYVYVKFILSELLKGNLPDIDTNDKSNFGIDCSDEFCKLLLDCNKILATCNEENPNFADIKDDYLISLIYCGLCCDEVILETESVPIQAATLFFHAFSNKYMDAFTVNRDIICTVAGKALQIIEYRVHLHRTISSSLILALNDFLEVNTNTLPIEKTVDLLISVLTRNNTSLNESFVADNVVSKSIYTCLTTIIKKQSSNIFRDGFVMITFRLLGCFTSEALTCGIIDFFDRVLHKYCDEDWYLSLLMAVFTQIKNKETFIKIINQLPIERYENMINLIVSQYVQAKSHREIESYLRIMNLIVTVPYPNLPDKRRQKIVSCILAETYFRSSHNSRVVKEHVMELFINWCQMRDIIVRRNLQQMFQTTNKIQAARLFEILLEDVDISWKLPAYNVTFIIFTCHMFILNKYFISQYRMRVLEMLCHKATPHCLKPCVPIIVEMIKHFTSSTHPILKPMLNIMIENALSPTNTANYYLKEIFDLLSDCMVATNDSDLEFLLCNILLSDDFNCVKLFKALQINNFVRSEHIEVLINEKVLKYPCSWKLLSVILENAEYSQFPQYMEFYITKMKSPGFFSIPEAAYTMQVLNKIFTAKIRRDRFSNSDRKLAEMIEKYLTGFIRTLTIPAKYISDTFALLRTVNGVTDTDFAWVNKFFKQTLNCILSKDIVGIELPFTRHLMYLEQMLLMLNMQVKPDDLKKIIEFMSVKNQALITNEHVYTRLLSFFGKICLKYDYQIPDGLSQIEYAMINGSPQVQVTAISTLCDMSRIKLNCYEVLYPGLVTLLKSTSADVKTVAIKIIVKLINEDYLRVTLNDFITLMMVLADRNEKMCMYYIDLLEKEFILRNQHTVAKYFIHLLFYLNGYKNNKTYPVLVETVSFEHNDFTYDRRVVIYKSLYGNLERHSQLQILNALNDNFLIPLCAGNISRSTNMLNILRDVLSLVAFNASHYMNIIEINESEIHEFYKALFEDMKRDFFTRKRFIEISDMESDRTLQKLLISLLKILYKIEKANVALLPQVFCTIAVATRAYYNKILHMVHENNVLKNLYYEFENCYTEYKEMAKNEPLDLLSQCVNQPWKIFLA